MVAEKNLHAKKFNEKLAALEFLIFVNLPKLNLKNK